MLEAATERERDRERQREAEGGREGERESARELACTAAWNLMQAATHTQTKDMCTSANSRKLS